LRASNVQLVEWIFRQQGFSFIFLLLLYGLGGFVILVGSGMALYVGYCVLIRMVVAVKNGAARISVPAAQLLGALLCWAAEMATELLCGELHSAIAKLTALRQERRQLRQIYRLD
jgi:predicted ABC-type sugar transport system permease subunit